MKITIEITEEDYNIIQTTETNLEEEPDTLERLLDSIYNGTVVEEIEVLKKEPCEDAISREDTMTALRADPSFICSGDKLNAIRVVEGMSPVTSTVKTGHWINIEDRTDWYDAAYKCSCCGREIITPYELKNNLYSDYPYCHCGAKMVEPQESEG